MTKLVSSQAIGVIGAGTMGAGIAQVAAAAGHPVRLFDAQPGAAQKGRDRVRQGLEALVSRGKLDADQGRGIVDRIAPVERIEDLAGCALVVEAILEDIAVKRSLFGQLEEILDETAILATNTSSLSVTSIASTCGRPGRVVGMHFFNPAPVMKLVEVVSGLATDRSVAECVFATAEAWGKIPVHTKSTPGFIVNRVARPYYAEALRLLEEQVADPATIDALCIGAGFRMGPFTLMDLIGNDVNYAVTRSVFDAYYQDPRFRPSLVQLELVDAGRFGRKSGRGFYDYADDASRPEAAVEPSASAPALAALEFGAAQIVEGALIAPTDGRPAYVRAQAEGRPVLLLDLGFDGMAGPIGFAASLDVPPALIAGFVATLQARGIAAVRLPDWPGLVVTRMIAMLANEGFEAVLHGVATEGGVDSAMRYGVNYPRGPIEWARRIGIERVLAVLDNIKAETGDPRYRASLGLREAARLARQDASQPGDTRH